MSFIERNLSRFTTLLQDTLFAEETASRNGLLQRIDPRAKIATFVFLIVASSFSRSPMVILAIYFLGLLLAAASQLFSIMFIRRIWLFMPLYTAFVALPAVFIIPGDPLFHQTWISKQGAYSAVFLILRVATSVSFMLMLVLTTSWPRLLKALRHLGVPRSLVFLLTITYRYIYVLLNTANSFFLARKSRQVGQEKWQSTREWLGMFMGSLLGKSYQLSNEVYLAMQSRGFRGEPVILSDFQWKQRDTIWTIFLFSFGGASLYLGYWRFL